MSEMKLEMGYTLISSPLDLRICQGRERSHKTRSSPRGSSTTSDAVSKRIVARRCKLYESQPGSPRVMKLIQAECIHTFLSSASHCALSGFDDCICCIQCILPYFLSIER